MTFLQYLRGTSKKAVAVLTIISCIAIAVFAQRIESQNQGKRYGDPDFIGEAVNLSVVNADVRDILNYITEQYGINFVIDKSVSKVPVTVNISEVPWNVALDAILSSQELDVQVKGPILRIADKKTLAAESEVQLKIKEAQLNSSPLYTEFIRLNYARAAGNQQGGQFTTGTSVGGMGGGMGGGIGSLGGIGGAMADGVLPIVAKRLSKRGSIEIDSRSNSLIITDVKENIDSIRKLVEILDQPEPQVEVEARVVVASRDFSRDIGVQLSGLVMGNRNGNSLGATGGTISNGTENTNGNVLNSQPNGSLTSQIANSVLALTTGRIGTAQIDLLITAGENKGQAKTIATPRVSTLNNRKATVESGQQIPIVTSQTGANGGGVVFTTEYVSVPLKLEVTPQITGDGTVLLEVVVENSSVSSTISVGGTPGLSTQRSQVNVMVPDGGTTVIGGALIDVEGENQFRTPGLSRVPVIGNLFKRKAVSRTTNEIIFFITPRIIRADLPNEGKAKERQNITIPQPVPLGNPSSNSLPKSADSQPLTVVPSAQQNAPATPAATTTSQPAKP